MRFVKPVLALWHLNRYVFQTGLAELLIHTGMNGERAEHLSPGLLTICSISDHDDFHNGYAGNLR